MTSSIDGTSSLLSHYSSELVHTLANHEKSSLKAIQTASEVDKQLAKIRVEETVQDSRIKNIDEYV